MAAFCIWHEYFNMRARRSHRGGPAHLRGPPRASRLQRTERSTWVEHSFIVSHALATEKVLILISATVAYPALGRLHRLPTCPSARLPGRFAPWRSDRP